MIPKNIHLVFLRKDESFPELFTQCKERIELMHPTWNIRLYNEDDALEIFKKYLPDFVDIYASFRHNIQKADFLRIALVYVFGGFYMDLDMLSLKPLDELARHKLVLAEEKTICENERMHLNLKHKLRIANYMFGGIAKHPFWLSLMNEMAKRSGVLINSQQDILDITGPGLLTDLYHDEMTLYPEIQLLRNYDKECLQDYHNEISCHFGDYAAHLHSGTWRSESY